MTDTRRVVCRAVNCSMRNTVVTTALSECLSCGAELKPEIDLSHLFPNDGDLGDLLGGLYGKKR